jgi:hypothetical protein
LAHSKQKFQTRHSLFVPKQRLNENFIDFVMQVQTNSLKAGGQHFKVIEQDFAYFNQWPSHFRKQAFRAFSNSNRLSHLN